MVSEVLVETWRSSALWKHLLRSCKRFLLIHPVDFVMSHVCVHGDLPSWAVLGGGSSPCIPKDPGGSWGVQCGITVPCILLEVGKLFSCELHQSQPPWPDCPWLQG